MINKEFLKIFFLICVSLIIFSCNKDTPQKPPVTNTPKTDINDENEVDTNMTAEEIFSSALVQNILGIDEDDDLEVYLEEQIYPIVSKSNKVTLDRISSSEYLLTYDDTGVRKNFIIQKFYNPEKDEFVFERKEAQPNTVKEFTK